MTLSPPLMRGDRNKEQLHFCNHCFKYVSARTIFRHRQSDRQLNGNRNLMTSETQLTVSDSESVEYSECSLSDFHIDSDYLNESDVAGNAIELSTVNSDTTRSDTNNSSSEIQIDSDYLYENDLLRNRIDLDSADSDFFDYGYDVYDYDENPDGSVILLYF